ncbi:MAG: hypothetical protein KA925_00980 [Pseudoxanthomonas sp.]|nr:hypothetical protein [Pseudoxanthomonas sp.]MBP7464715.1 hypothetical protein [Pseudoxanthomonas sp.]MBP8740759.1 hypothetical protein [Pseudoxanthomonas sp.]MBP8804524.1 hypothetical protein [Pseudoxanthomonas sp.]MBP9534474.1 hypothetical protein [Pseudoxanthomonas sp.]
MPCPRWPRSARARGGPGPASVAQALVVALAVAWAAPDAAATIGQDAGDGPRAVTRAVTIYRCSDAAGRLVALRDSPCRDGERQQTLQMQRPLDPPPRPATAPAPAPASERPVQEIRIVTVPAPQPMYECTAPDGQVYTSDSEQGNRRWVPLWSVGRPLGPWTRPPHRPPAWPQPPAQPAPPVRPPGGTPGGVPPPAPGPHPPRPPVVVAIPGGSWVHDPCVRLPQQDVCRRLSDRRFEILRIYHAAMPSGRAELDREQARIDARMANDCPNF